jgi:hypothetical protein
MSSATQAVPIVCSAGQTNSSNYTHQNNHNTQKKIRKHIQKTPKNITHLKVGLINIRGLQPNSKATFDECRNSEINLFFATETFFSSSNRLHAPGWVGHHNYAEQRRDHNYGGISLFVHEDINTHTIVLPIIHPHILSCRIGTLTIHCIYLPPTKYPVEHNFNNTHAMEILNKIHITPNTIVLGDFNTRLGSIVGDTKSNSRRTPFLEWVQRHDLHIWNTTHAKGKCTFENHQGKSIIDFFISPYNLIPNPSSLHIHSDVTVGSDHYLCSMELPLPGNIIQKIKEKNASPPPRQIWRLAKFEEWEVRDSYIDHFTTISAPLYDNLMSVYQQLTSSTSSSSASTINFGTPRPKDIEVYTEELNQSIYSALDLTVGRTGNRPSDWNWYWNKHLDDIAQQRTKLFRRWKRSAGRSPFDRLPLFQAYTKQNQILHSEIKKAKRANWRHLCNKLRNNPVEMMASIKRKRLSQRTNVTYTHPEGPEAAVTSMVQHLDRVFGNTPSTASPSSPSIPISTPHPSSPSTTLPEHIEQYYTPSRIQNDLHLHSNPASDEYDLDLHTGAKKCMEFSNLPISKWKAISMR